MSDAKINSWYVISVDITMDGAQRAKKYTLIVQLYTTAGEML